MNTTYKVDGMTCNNCKRHVTEAIEKISGVSGVEINLESKEVAISSAEPISYSEIANSLPSKYTLLANSQIEEEVSKSKLKELQPLFIIIAYVASGAFLMNIDSLFINDIMLDFMGLFFVAFSLFKVLDIPGFAESFAMYDPLAKRAKIYGYIYPFMEIGLGILFLMRWNIMFALIATILVLGITTVGVTRSILSKSEIKCACLGSTLNLPMTEATFIENALMIVMSLFMLFSLAM